MSAFALSIIIAFTSSLVVWRIDQSKYSCATKFRLVPTVALVLLSVWLISLIILSRILEVPGAFGPVQFWVGNERAYSFIEGPRIWALFVAIGGLGVVAATVISTTISIFVKSLSNRWYRLVTPAVAISLYGVAYYLMVYYNFYPSA